jgi:hypothetical protein
MANLIDQIELKHKVITDKILHAFFKIVYPQLGYGFLEKVYQNALLIALKDLGMEVQPQLKIDVFSRGMQSENISQICWLRKLSSWNLKLCPTS